MPQALDQLNISSCAANASSNVLKYLLNCNWQPSRLFIYWNTRVNIANQSPNTDSGVCLRDNFKAIKAYKVCDENVWPYDVSKYDDKPSDDAYRNMKNIDIVYEKVNPEDIKHVLYEGIPIIVGIQIYDSIYTDAVRYSGEVNMPGPSERCLGGHAIAIVGYDDSTRKFKCLNSWGGWGKNGCFNIPYDYINSDTLTFDRWAMTVSTPAPTPAPQPQPIPVPQLFPTPLPFPYIQPLPFPPFPNFIYKN